MPDLKPCQSEWKPIEGWPYSVSDDGHVRNDRTGHILKMHEMNRGYLDVLLCNNGISQNKTVHRLVAEAFIPNPECKPQVNHKDGNKKNNHVSNLEWVTNSENQLHCCHVLGKMPSEGSLAKKREMSFEVCRKPVRCIETNIVYESVRAAAKENGVSRFAVSNALRGKQNRAAGLHWEFVSRAGEEDKHENLD